MVEMNDTGQRMESATGALSDPGHSQAAFELLSPFSLYDLATWLGKGAEKYAPRNWEKGIPFSVCIGKLLRHTAKFQMGLTDEDHLSAVGFWWHALAHYRKMIADGVLPANLNDLPKYGTISVCSNEYQSFLCGDENQVPMEDRRCRNCKHIAICPNDVPCSDCGPYPNHKNWKLENA